MKPSKKKIFCRDCNRQKILFETQKKADTFIAFNAKEIEKEKGYAPIRSYFCVTCNGWHVTSGHFKNGVKSITHNIIKEYQLDMLKIKSERLNEKNI